MKKLANRFIPAAIFSVLFLGQGMFLEASDASHCYSTDKTKKHFRKEEALRKVEELNSQIMNALDKVLLTTGSEDPEFCPNIEFVLDKQYDREHMDVQIETFSITNQCEFLGVWNNLAKLYNYRKRNITNYIKVDYSDDDCVREVTVYGIGMSFGVLNYLPCETENPDYNPDFPGPPWHSTNNFVDFDRFQITWKEKHPGDFRVTSLVQYTESSFPMLDAVEPPFCEQSPFPNGVAGLIPGRSPFLPNAPGNYEVPPPKDGCPQDHDCPPA